MADGEEGHLSRYLLQRFLDGSLDEREAAEVFAHLLAGCPRCGDEVAELACPMPGRYDFAFIRARARNKENLEALALARREVHLRFVGVLQGELGRQEESPLYKWAWCELLLGLAELRRGKDLKGSVDLASLAAFTADLLTGPFSAAQLAALRARAWAELGNLQRMANDLEGADESLGIAIGHLHDSFDDFLLARVFDFFGSLYCDQRRFPEAIRALDRAAHLYLGVGERHRAGRALVTKAVVFIHAERPDHALAALEAAFGWLDASRDHGLVLAAIHNSLLALVDTAQHERAARLLWRCRPLYQAHATPLDRVRLLGLEAKVAAGLGQPGRAERLFREEKAGFEEAGLAYDSALVGLDLAALLVEQGRPAEVIPLVDEMLGSFHERGILREAFASLLLLRKAIEQGEATVALVRTLSEELKKLDRAARDR